MKFGKRITSILIINFLKIIFDEAHYAKSAFGKKRSIRGEIVFKLQAMHPLARIVYSTATGASEVHHLLYLHRLGIWGYNTAYKDVGDFEDVMKSR